MRLPTKDEWEAYEAETLAIHKACATTGVCIHKEEIMALCRLLYKSSMFAASADVAAMIPLDQQLYLFTVAFREGMFLGMKMAERDLMETLCSGKS